MRDEIPPIANRMLEERVGDVTRMSQSVRRRMKEGIRRMHGGIKPPTDRAKFHQLYHLITRLPGDFIISDAANKVFHIHFCIRLPMSTRQTPFYVNEKAFLPRFNLSAVFRF